MEIGPGVGVGEAVGVFVAKGVTVGVAGTVGDGVTGVGVAVGQKVMAFRIFGANNQPMYTTMMPFGIPTFMFEVTGTDNAGVSHKWVRALTMDDGALRKGTVITDVPLGTYTIREINVSRYYFEELTIDVGEGSVSGKVATVTINGEHQEAEVTYKNKIEQYEKFSHSSAVTNHVGSTSTPPATEPEEPVPDESYPSGE